MKPYLLLFFISLTTIISCNKKKSNHITAQVIHEDLYKAGSRTDQESNQIKEGLHLLFSETSISKNIADSIAEIIKHGKLFRSETNQTTIQFYGGEITDTIELTLKRDLSFFKKKSNPGIVAPSNLEYKLISNEKGYFLKIENYIEFPNGDNSKNTLKVSENSTLYKLDTTDNKFYDESGNILENVTTTDLHRSPGVYILSIKTKGSETEKTITHNTSVLKDTLSTPYIVRFQNTEKALQE